MPHPNPSTRWQIDAGWRLYARLPEPVLNALGRCLPYVLPCHGLRIPVAILRGPTCLDGHPGTMIVAGAEPWVDYLPHRFFKDPPQREMVGRVPLWTLPHILKPLWTSADLTVARVDRLSARLLFNADYLAIPEWVGSWLTVPDDLAKRVRASGSVREDLRKIRREGFTAEISHVEADFEMFYRTMYVPFIRNRHGAQAIIRNVYQLRRCFRRGRLVWVRHGGRRIAGGLVEQRDNVIHLRVLGTENGESTPVKAGALAALYYYEIEYAHSQGCTRVDFGGSRPSLNDGVLRFKRKWGVRLTEKHDIHYDFLLHWNRLDGKVAAFFSQTPLIFRHQGGLSAVAAINKQTPATEADAWMAHRSMWMPGLDRFYLIAKYGWQPGINSPRQAVLIDPIDAGDYDPYRLLAVGYQPLRPGLADIA